MSLTHIETIELGSSQASITFSSIPQDYDDLVLKISARSSRAAENFGGLTVEFNGVSSNLSSIRLRGDGSSGGSASYSYIYCTIPASNSTSNTFSNSSIYISNYTASQAKSVSIDSVGENNASEGIQDLFAGLWNNTAAITSIELAELFSANFVTGCVASLYGVTSGGDGTVSTA